MMVDKGNICKEINEPWFLSHTIYEIEHKPKFKKKNNKHFRRKHRKKSLCPWGKEVLDTKITNYFKK